MNRAQPGRERTDGFRSAGAPDITNRAITGERGGYEPLRFLIDTHSEHSGRRVPTGDPIETDAFTIQINASASWVPLHKHLPDTESQPTEIVAPDKFCGSAASDLDHDVRHDLVGAENVSRPKRGEVRLTHQPATVRN